MTTVKLWTDSEVAANSRIKAIFDDIRTTRKSDFVNNFWRALANQPELLERTWLSIKQVMIEPGALDPLTKELIYIAVSTANNLQLLRPLTHRRSPLQGPHRSAARRTPRRHRHGLRDQRSRHGSPDPRRSRIHSRINLAISPDRQRQAPADSRPSSRRPYWLTPGETLLHQQARSNTRPDSRSQQDSNNRRDSPANPPNLRRKSTRA